MRNLDLHFEFTKGNSIRVEELNIENEGVDLTKYKKLGNPNVYEGDISREILDKLEVYVSCRGRSPGEKWQLEIKVGSKKLTEKPIVGKISSNGTSTHYDSYKLP